MISISVSESGSTLSNIGGSGLSGCAVVSATVSEASCGYPSIGVSHLVTHLGIEVSREHAVVIGRTRGTYRVRPT